MSVYIRDNGRGPQPSSIGGVEVQRGPRGPKGDKGDSTGAHSCLSTGPLASLQVVYFVDTVHVAAADANTVAHAQRVLGVNTNAATGPEQSVRVVYKDRVQSSSWSWIPGQVVFCGLNGTLTQLYDPNWSFVSIVGVALTADTIDVSLRHSIL